MFSQFNIAQLLKTEILKLLWMELETIILSEITHTPERQMSHFLSFVDVVSFDWRLRGQFQRRGDRAQWYNGLNGSDGTRVVKLEWWMGNQDIVENGEGETTKTCQKSHMETNSRHFLKVIIISPCLEIFYF